MNIEEKIIKRIFIKDEIYQGFLNILSTLFTFFSLLLIGKIYSQEQFGTFSIFYSITGIILSFSTSRYEVPISLTSRYREAKKFAVTANFIALSFSIFIFFISLFLVLIFKSNGINQYKFLFFVGPTIYFLSIYNINKSLSITNKRINLIPKFKLFQSLTTTFFQYFLSFGQFYSIGIILGYFFGILITSLTYSSVQILKFIRRGFSIISSYKITSRVIKQYPDYWRYSILDSLLNTAALQLPILLLAFYTNTEQIGIISMATFIMQGPIILFGTSFAQLFLRKLSNTDQDDNYNLKKSGRKFSLIILIIGIIPTLFFGLLLIPLIIPNLWKGWISLPTLCLMMLPWSCLQLYSSPLSPIFYKIKKNHKMFYLQLLNLALRIGPIFVYGTFFEVSNLGIQLSYIVGATVFYFIYSLMIYIEFL